MPNLKKIFLSHLENFKQSSHFLVRFLLIKSVRAQKSVVCFSLSRLDFN